MIPEDVSGTTAQPFLPEGASLPGLSIGGRRLGPRCGSAAGRRRFHILAGPSAAPPPLRAGRGSSRPPRCPRSLRCGCRGGRREEGFGRRGGGEHTATAAAGRHSVRGGGSRGVEQAAGFQETPRLEAASKVLPAGLAMHRAGGPRTMRHSRPLSGFGRGSGLVLHFGEAGGTGRAKTRSSLGFTLFSGVSLGASLEI